MKKKLFIYLCIVSTLFAREPWLNERNINEALAIFDAGTMVQNEENLQKYIEKFTPITKMHLKREKDVLKEFRKIQEKFFRNNLPICLSYIPFAESNFTPNVHGYGSVGLWQLTKGSAKSLGLRVSKKIDERKDIEKSTTAAIKYLKRLQTLYTKPYLIDFAYGLGEGTLSKILNSTPNATFSQIWNHPLMKYGTKAHFTKILLMCSAKQTNYSGSDKEDGESQTGTDKLFQETLSTDESKTMNQSEVLLNTP